TGQARDFARGLLKLLASPLEVALERRLLALLLLLLFLRLLVCLLLLLLSLLLLSLLLRLLVLLLWVVGLPDSGGARKTEHERRQAENLDSVSHRRASKHVLRPSRVGRESSRLCLRVAHVHERVHEIDTLSPKRDALRLGH